MRVTYRQAALTDVTRQVRYYLVELDLPRIAEQFKEAVKRTARDISRHPDIAPPCYLRNPELQSLRSWPVEGFEAIRLYYLVENDAMRVIRVLHGMRDVRGMLEREKPSTD